MVDTGLVISILPAQHSTLLNNVGQLMRSLAQFGSVGAEL
jgi:hypothetical protein